MNFWLAWICSQIVYMEEVSFKVEFREIGTPCVQVLNTFWGLYGEVRSGFGLLISERFRGVSEVQA